MIWHNRIHLPIKCGSSLVLSAIHLSRCQKVDQHAPRVQNILSFLRGSCFEDQVVMFWHFHIWAYSGLMCFFFKDCHWLSPDNFQLYPQLICWNTGSRVSKWPLYSLWVSVCLCVQSITPCTLIRSWWNLVMCSISMSSCVFLDEGVLRPLWAEPRPKK